MSYFSNLALRLRRSPWMMVIWFTYPFLLTYIIYISFSRQDSFQVHVGVVLPKPLQDNSLLSQILTRPFGPYHFHILNRPDPKSVAENIELSLILVIPEDIQNHLLDKQPITVLALTNPEQRIKPAASLDLVELLASLANNFLGLAREPLKQQLQLPSPPSLEQVLAVSRTWYQTMTEHQAIFQKINQIHVRSPATQSSSNREKSGRRLYQLTFWIMFLANSIFFISAIQNLFLHDLNVSMLVRWQASPHGLFKAYQDTLLFCFLFGVGLCLVAWVASVFLLGVPSPPLNRTGFVIFSIILFNLGFAQLGYLFARSEKAARAFVGITGSALFFLGGGVQLLVPGIFGSIGDYLPIALGLKSMIDPTPFPWLMLIECLPIAIIGTTFYARHLKRMVL